MEEKVLIKSKLMRNQLYVITAIIIGIGFVAWLMFFTSYIENYELGYRYTYERTWGDVLTSNYTWTSIFPYTASMTLLPPLVLAIIYYFLYFKTSLTVTDKRVYGYAAFGKRVDLPIDSVSAVGITAISKGISVSTSSGAIKFGMISNREDIHKVISDLLIERQSKKNSNSDVTQNVNLSNADELQKYKILLDNGTITQDEFEVKKKQLLGL